MREFCILKGKIKMMKFHNKIKSTINFQLLKKLTLSFLLLGHISASAMNLEDYLKAVQEKNKMFQSLNSSAQASYEKKISGDSALMPVLTLKRSFLNDKNPRPINVNAFVQYMNVSEYSIGIAKKFSTGTAFSANTALGKSTTSFLSNSTPIDVEQGNSSLNFGVSQSLWKDAFGTSTRLRWEREAHIESIEKTALRIQSQSVLMDAEIAFWDFIYAREDLKVKKSNLQKAEKLKAWMTKRVSNGLSERSDLVQIEALVASRSLMLSISKDDYEAARKKIATHLESSGNLPEFEARIGDERKIDNLVSGKLHKGRVIDWESFASVAESKLKNAVSREVSEGLKPDLQLKASYTTNGIGASSDENIKNLVKTDKATQAVALEFTYLLDGDVKSSVKNAALLDAQASRLKSERKVLEGESQWSELQRRWSEMTSKIKTTELISKLQNERARLESDKLEKGRTVTSQVIMAEQDAADAELNLIKLKAEHRKIEARARMFVVLEEEGT
jgi:outer membrane protein TolC